MIIFSCCSYTANKASNWFLSDKGALAPAAGALVIGLLGNIYSRWSRGTAFTSMVTGVLFLVPVCVPKSSLFCPVSLALALLGVLAEGELLAYLYTLLLVWPCPSWWSYWKLRQLCATVLQQFLTRSAHDPSCNRRHHRPLRQPKYYICVQCREQRCRHGFLKHKNTTTKYE
jgi:hypothetical protein